MRVESCNPLKGDMCAPRSGKRVTTMTSHTLSLSLPKLSYSGDNVNLNLHPKFVSCNWQLRCSSDLLE